ncbi:MAG: 2-C-methyl-D-erythritol 2,4-cyclodiphosphate synthase [candidate division WOR-3 bacterium]
MRVGIGFDIHPLKEGRKLFLGGCEIPHPKGLLGHSDGDCLIHAIVDAILGALGKGDIGSLFPDTDPKYKGVRSVLFLEEVGKILREVGVRVINVDSVVVCEEPKIAPYRTEMQKEIGKALGCDPKLISIKGKRPEGLINKESILSYAVVLLEGI